MVCAEIMSNTKDLNKKMLNKYILEIYNFNSLNIHPEKSIVKS